MSRRRVLLAVAATVLVHAAAAGGQTGGEVRNDRYQFAPGQSTEVFVALERTPDGVQFAWPAVKSAWDTALLAVRSTGAEPRPWVEITIGSARLEQHLDANAVVLRWLNVSSLRPQLLEGATVRVNTHAVTIEPGPASLRLFANGLDLGDTILVLAPHPDDAEIAAFGLYADRKATIVTVTSGNAGDRTPADNQTVRNVFIVGPDKKIKLILVYPMTTGRNFDEVLRVIDSLQMTAKHRVATPANWKQGEDVILTGAVTDDEAKKLYPQGWKSPKPYIRIVPQPRA